VVQNASAGELHYEAKRSQHAEPLQANEVERDLHFKIAEFTQPSYFRVGADWDLVYTLEKLATTVGTKALVLYAELTTAVRANGEEWLQVDYRLQNRSLQFLPVRLPEGYTLMSAMVNDQAVRADHGLRDQSPVLLIPLIQTRPGDLALQVRLVCRRLPNALGKLPDTMNLALDDPELPGVTIERTVWRVALPKGYSVKDSRGNMDAVSGNDAKFEQEAAVVTELSSLITMCATPSNSTELRERSRRNAQNIVSTYNNGRVNNGRASQVDALIDQLNKVSINDIPGKGGAPGMSLQLQTEAASNTWNWSDNSGYLKTRELKQAEITKQETQLNKDNLGLNDNVIVGNRALFFKYNEDQTKGKKDDSKKADGKDANQRSQAVSRLQQADAGDATQVGDQLKQLEQQRFTSTMDEANFSGGINLNGAMVRGDGVIQQQADGAVATVSGLILSSNRIDNNVFLNSNDGSLTTKNNVDFQQNYRNAGNRGGVQMQGGQQVDQVKNASAAAAILSPGLIAATPESPAAPFEDSAKVKIAFKDEDISAPQKLRPAGRVSLPITVLADTPLTFFKKVKDHASITLVVQKGSEDPSKRITASMILLCSMFALIAINAVAKARQRRRG
jgi:hypothetical protein